MRGELLDHTLSGMLTLGLRIFIAQLVLPSNGRVQSRTSSSGKCSLDFRNQTIDQLPNDRFKSEIRLRADDPSINQQSKSTDKFAK